MNKIATTICALAISLSAFAQAPEKMSYQAVIRDAGNVLVTNQNVGMQISILQGAPNGTPVYVETQMPMSNLNGLVTIEIGAGSVVSGAFNTSDWSNGPYFIKTETDPVGGTSYSIMGTSELLSVPYALHAKTAESISGTIPELDPVFMNSIVGSITTMDTANWNHHTIDTDTHLTESEVDAFVSNNGYLTSEVDGSVTNEIQSISRSGTTVTLSNGGGSFTDSVNVYTAGTGIDITNNVVSATASSKNILYLTADSVLTSSDDMLVFIDGAYKVTMPASPANGQEIVLCTKNGSASIDANTGRVFQIALTTFASLTFTTGSTNMYRCIYSSDLDTWFILYT